MLSHAMSMSLEVWHSKVPIVMSGIDGGETNCNSSYTCLISDDAKDNPSLSSVDLMAETAGLKYPKAAKLIKKSPDTLSRRICDLFAPPSALSVSGAIVDKFKCLDLLPSACSYEEAEIEFDHSPNDEEDRSQSFIFLINGSTTERDSDERSDKSPQLGYESPSAKSQFSEFDEAAILRMSLWVAGEVIDEFVKELLPSLIARFTKLDGIYREIGAGERDGTSTAGGSSRPGSSPQSGSSQRSGKRPSHSDSVPPGDDPPGSRKRPRRSTDQNPPSNTDYERLACPFYVRYPRKYGRGRACSGPGFQTIGLLK